ncbi:MAG TPA: right-handed parallel beta-helix repeat-containing protein, partial [Armatimonadota bacterium]|nr:right-handed parallel beta-helix repeat-containing protein [Armatimonadota bacterium]
GGDRKTLLSADLAAVNNHIHHFGQWSRCYQPAVMVTGVGNRVAHNVIHDGPHNAIQLGGTDHVIEYNEISRVCLETGDVGAFYMGRDWTQRGNIIRYNYFHDTGGVGMGSMAVYLDDCTSGTTVFGNIFYRTTRAAFIGGGCDNVVENNIFVECKPAVSLDGRGLDTSPTWHNMVYDTMRKRLDAMNYHQPPYAEQYPELAKLDAYYAANNGVPPVGNKILRNISIGGQWLQVGWHATADMLELRDNLVDIDPHFVDRSKANFQLQKDSPAFTLGFQPIPVQQIGLYRDQYRQ